MVSTWLALHDLIMQQGDKRLLQQHHRKYSSPGQDCHTLGKNDSPAFLPTGEKADHSLVAAPLGNLSCEALRIVELWESSSTLTVGRPQSWTFCHVILCIEALSELPGGVLADELRSAGLMLCCRNNFAMLSQY